MQKILEYNGKTFVAVCRSTAVVATRGTRASLDELTDVAVFRVQGVCHVLSNLCPHQHHALIAEGVLENNSVTCPMHGWQFDITTGLEQSGLGRIKRYESLEEDGTVFVEFDAEDLPAWMKS